MIENFFKIVDWIDEKTFDVLPPLSVRGKIAEVIDQDGIPETTQHNLELTEGRYLLTYKPINNLIFDFKSVVLDAGASTERLRGKKFRVVAMSVFPDKLQVTVDVLQNPIPLFVVSALIISLAVSIAALSTGAALTKVEKVFVTPTMSILALIGLTGLGMYFFRKAKRR